MSGCGRWFVVVPLLVSVSGCTTLERERIETGFGTLEESPRSDCALKALDLALTGLPDEGFRTFRQLRLPDHAPLQRFPRLTAPAFVSPCENRKWYVPVLFEARTEETIASTPPPSASRDPDFEGSHRLSFDGARPEDALSYWLERSPGDGGPTSLIEIPRRQILPARLLFGPGRERMRDLLGGGAGVVLELEEDPGFYWLRIAPRFGDGRERDGPFMRAVARGDLKGVLSMLRGRDRLRPPDLIGPPYPDVTGLDVLFGCVCAAQRLGLNQCKHPYKHFWPEMREATKRVGRSGPREEAKLLKALRALYEGEFSPAGVLLDDPKTTGQAFSFAIGADTQNSTDMSAFQRFMQVIEEGAQNPQSRKPKGWTLSQNRRLRYEPAWKPTVAALREELAVHRSRIHFVLIAGDLGDARAGSDLGRMAFNALGAYPPISTYETEYPSMAREIRRLPVPFVAVPGNHDGMVGYPGLLNRGANLFGPLSRVVDRSNDFVPVFVKIPWPERWPWSDTPDVPRYDGLAEWIYALGPTSYVFNYHGQTFAGFNSFHLTQRERAGVGSVVFNWGGGVTDADVDSLEQRLDRLGEPAGHQFLYMHHDPRGATPLKKTLEVDRYGVYDEIDNWASAYTLGHIGLGHSPMWDVYLPVATPLMHHSTRLLDDWLSGRGRSQEEWMRRTFAFRVQEKYPEQHGARRLVEAISARLYPVSSGGGISHVFFGHNDVPLGPDEWVHTASDRHVFIELPQGEWHEGREYHLHLGKLPFVPYTKPLLNFLFKLRNDEPPDWAKALQPAEGNASVVRLDDVANPGGVHGFHLVTVVPRECKAGTGCGADVHVKWFPLPTERIQ